METFIVLGLCFILYEALDLFQSCYNKERHQQRQQDSDFGGSASSTSNTDSTNCIAANRSASDSISVSKDTAHLMPLDAIDENDLDSDDNNQLNQHLDKNKIYSICDRVIHQHFNNNNNTNYNLNNNTVVCVDDNDKLIVG